MEFQLVLGLSSYKDIKQTTMQLIVDHTVRYSYFYYYYHYHYSQLSLRRTPLGPALAVRLREMSVL